MPPLLAAADAAIFAIASRCRRYIAAFFQAPDYAIAADIFAMFSRRWFAYRLLRRFTIFRFHFRHAFH